MGALRLWLIGLLLACAQGAWAQQPAAVPALNRPVTDLTSTLDAAQIARLEATLRAFEQRKGSQIAVLIVPSTQPEAIEQYAIRVAEQWKIGRKKVDDGAILIVAKDDRALRIEVGYGLEGALNDATSRRIIEEAITPRFRSGDFYGGIAAGLDGMVKVIDGEPLPAPAAQAGQGSRAGQAGRAPQLGGLGQMLPVALVGAVVLGGVLRAVLGRLLGAAVTGGVIGVGAFLMAGVLAAALAGGIAFLFTLLSGGMGAGRGRGGWIGGGGLGGLGGLGGGFGGGGGGGGGFGGGGGGWGGGGGGFGGGGASGRW
jgi:uncharacterized protein